MFFTNFFYLLYFFFAAIILTISPRHFWLQILSIIAASVGIIVFGLGASDLIAQDRSAYFYMYQNAVPDRAFYEDIIFNYFLIILPDSLTENAFFFVLNSISLSLLFATLFLLSREFSISFYLLLIVFSIILVDRIWFDLMFNTLRSTWAIMLFICAICSKSSLLKLILFIASLGVHFFAGMGMFILYLFSHLLILKPKSLILLATFCIIMFLYKFFDGELLYLTQNYNLIPAFEDARLARASQVEIRNFSLSLKIQLFLAIIVPTLLGVFNKKAQIIDKSIKVKPLKLISLSIVSTLFILITFPDIWFAIRFSLIPMLIFSLLISHKLLLPILWIKLTIIAISIN